MIMKKSHCVRRPEARTPKSQISALGISHNVSGLRRLVKRASVEPNVSEQNARMSTFWRGPRSEPKVSDEAINRVLYDRS